MKGLLTSSMVIVMLSCYTTIVDARNWVSGYTITKVYDQRPHKNNLDIDITPELYGCSTLSFVVGQSGLTDEHLNRALSISLAALVSGKEVGGLWGEPQDGCLATNIHISK